MANKIIPELNMNHENQSRGIKKKLTAADALALSIPERIQLVEDIWDSIAAETDAIELTEEEKKIIDERLKEFHKNPDLGSPWEDVYRKIASEK